MALDEIAALLRSSGAALYKAQSIKKRLVGVTSLVEFLRKAHPNDVSAEELAALIPDVLPCLRDHNSKVVSSALEILEIVLESASEQTVRAYFKLLWLNLVEKLGDSKLPVREKAVDVVVQLTNVLDLATVLDKLLVRVAVHEKRCVVWNYGAYVLAIQTLLLDVQPCAGHKNWRTREQIIKLLEDSAKEVRDAAIQTLEKFYAHIGNSLLRDLESKHIRSAHMKMLTDRFQGIQGRDGRGTAATTSAIAYPLSSSSSLTSILSSYDLKQPASSSSMARYLESIRQRELSSAVAAKAIVGGEFSPSQSSTTSTKSDKSLCGGAEQANSQSGVSEKDIQREIATIFEQLQLDNDWSKRVDGLKKLQELAHTCGQTQDAATLMALSQGVRTVRERLCEQVADLRSSVSREACQTIQVLANVLRDDFNLHAEYVLGTLLKATYVTIQIISTSADTCIRGVIESTKNGYARFISKYTHGRREIKKPGAASSLCEILDAHAATLELQPPKQAEADNLFNRLDASTQKNLRDDAARTSENERLKANESDRSSVSRVNFNHSSDDVCTKSVAAFYVDGWVQWLESIVNFIYSYGDGSESGRFPSRVLSQGALRVGFDSRQKASSSNEEAGNDWKKQHTPVRPLRVLSSSEVTLPPKTAADNLFSTRPGGFQTSPLSGKPKRVQIASADVSVSSQSSVPDQQESGPSEKAKPVVSQASSSLASNVEKRLEPSVAASLQAKPASEPPSAKQTVKQVPMLPTNEKLEDAISSLESNSWSIRMDAVEYIGRVLVQKKQSQQPNDATRVDDRVLVAFIKHMGDAHYRVAQAVHKNFLSLLQLASPQQLQPHLKAILPKLFQKQVDTKESIRAIAKENLDYLLKTMDASVLTTSVLPLLMDGSNMKVKAAVCHYLRELLPGADAYMRQSNNNNHMRSFLSKMAQLLEGEMPVSVTTAVGELVQVSAKLYAAEVEAALPLLAPTKRTSLTKLLKSRGIAFSLNPAQSGIASISTSALSSSGSPRGSSREQQQQHVDNQAPEPVFLERSNRKRSESPNANSASPLRTTQKRKSANDIVKGDNKAVAPVLDFNKAASADLFSSASSSMFTTPVYPNSTSSSNAPKQAIPFEDLIDIVAQNNATERERRTAFHKILGYVKSGSHEFWDKHFGRLLFLLLDAGAEKDVSALKVLQGLVEMHSGRTHGYAHPILVRLLECLGDKANVASHLAENILSTLVSTTKQPEQLLDMLAPYLSSAEPPLLQVVLRLIKTGLEVCEKNVSPTRGFLREELWMAKLLVPVAQHLTHPSSDVRKCSVDALVAFHFAILEDDELMWGYLSNTVDATKKKLVQIFIERAKLERRQAAAS
ncbi:hypothetical protein FI667_g16352, partial [Globisporangium splendens]